jgi:transposase
MEVNNMSYVEIKNIAGKQYKYLIKAVREGDKIKKVFVKYLGPANPIYKTSNKRKTNASIFVRMLNNEEKDKLKLAVHSSNSFTKERAKIILLSSEGLFAKQIADKTNCEARKVRKAIVAFNQKGLTALERGKAKGAKIVFTELDKKIILIHFSKGPKAFNIAISYWTLPRLRKHLIDSKVVSSISIETLRQILLSNGAKLTKSKRWQYSPDKNFLRKKKQ